MNSVQVLALNFVLHNFSAPVVVWRPLKIFAGGAWSPGPPASTALIGRRGQDIRDTFEFETDKDDEDIVTVRMLFQKFEQYCRPKKNLIVEGHRFLTRNQEQSETIDQYVTKLKTLAASCEWGNLKDDLICSRIVSGIVSTRVRERLLRKPELKLTRAIEICQANELSLRQLKLFDDNKDVGAINKTCQPRRKYIPKTTSVEDRKPKQDRNERKAWKT